jgi:hypothetical protein
LFVWITFNAIEDNNFLNFFLKELPNIKDKLVIVKCCSKQYKKLWLRWAIFEGNFARPSVRPSQLDLRNGNSYRWTVFKFIICVFQRGALWGRQLLVLTESDLKVEKTWFYAQKIRSLEQKYWHSILLEKQV